MWDNVVSWMKTAVDYIAYEDPEDATVLSPIGKVMQSVFVFKTQFCTLYLFFAYPNRLAVYKNGRL